uniref:Uncharacterized protein n=1 Tax=Cannabis sativa TaxID=3483 RepID=A0A803P9R1_CANSA
MARVKRSRRLPNENQSATPLPRLNLEIERALKQLKAKKKLDFTTTANNNNGLNNNQPAPAAADAQPQAIRDYCLLVVNENLTDIANPVIAANNFELKHALINLVKHNQFGGLATEDPNIHLPIFLEVCATVKMNDVTDDAIRLGLFPFSLRDRARGGGRII